MSAMKAPTLETERLRLRHHRLSDMEAYWDFYQSSSRLALMDVPQTRTRLWYGWASEVASWELLGFGGWAVELHDGTLIGQVALTHPPHFPEPELGWFVFDAYEGKGLAYEAAAAAYDFALASPVLESFVSYIHQDNARSIALAERLGAQLDPQARSYAPHVSVYRHATSGRERAA